MKYFFSLFALLFLLACGEAPSASPQVVNISLMSLLENVDLRWIDLPDGRAPAIPATKTQRLDFPLDSSGSEARLKTSFGFAAPGRSGAAETTRATFRILCEEKLVLEESREAKPTVDVETTELDLPEACSLLTLEIDFEKRGGRRAVWIEPIVTFRRPRSEAAPSSFNLIVVTLDTTRRDALGPYGGAPTPALDRLAAGGVVFQEAYSAAYGTTPSHSSLFSSLPAAAHGVYDNSSVLAADRLTLAEVLRDIGYQTAAFVSAQPVKRAVGLHQGFDVYDDLFAFDALSGLGDFSRFERRADVTVDRFLDWYRQRGEEPFFVWLHFFDPHQPYAPPAANAAPESLRVRQHLSPKKAAEIEKQALRRYRGEIEFLDQQIGRVVEALDLKDTIVALTADHGENFLDRGSHLAFGHGGLYPEVSNVPLILRLPSGEKGERRALISSTDLAPTLVDLLGFDVPESWRGRSFRRRIAEDGAHRPHVILESAARFEIAVRTPEWTYREIGPEHRTPEIRRLLGYQPDSWRQLYDRIADPEERINLLAEGGEPPEELIRLIAEARARQTGAAEAIDSDSHREALEALGYLD